MADPVERLGLGLAALGRPAYITTGRDQDLGPERSLAAMRERTWAVLDAAHALGIRYVDAARSYGRAEEFLADWLADHAAAGLQVASKWGYRYVADWRRDAEVHEVKDHSLTAFREQHAQSAALLGSRLSVYQVHSVTPDSPALTDRELLQALAALREQGVRVGLSTSGPSQGEVIAASTSLVVDGEPLFTVVQSTWNLLEQSAGPALAAAAGAGVDVVVKECLANGRLSGDRSESVPDGVRTAAREMGLGLDQLAVAITLQQPWARRVLLGAVTTDQLERSVEAVRRADLPGLADLGPITESATSYWQARSRREWG